MSPKNLQQVETPCLVLERGKLEQHRACAITSPSSGGAAAASRPPRANRAPGLAGQPGGITVSTLKEAEQFFAHASPTSCGGHHLNSSITSALKRRGADITIILATWNPRDRRRARVALGIKFPALIEIDSDGHARRQTRRRRAASAASSRAADKLCGIMTHVGDS
jgi:D-serine deaminase-like pyridoxal phosphate-dependent protein